MQIYNGIGRDTYKSGHRRGVIRVSGHLPLVPIKNGTIDIPPACEQMRASQFAWAGDALAEDPVQVVHRGLLLETCLPIMAALSLLPLVIALLRCLSACWCNLLTYYL